MVRVSLLEIKLGADIRTIEVLRDINFMELKDAMIFLLRAFNFKHSDKDLSSASINRRYIIRMTLWFHSRLLLL